MGLLGREYHEELNGVTVRDSGWLLSWKSCWQGWGWHLSNEQGLCVIQIGPLVLEIWS